MEKEFKTKKEVFQYLDSQLTEKDRIELAQAKDISEYHFGLGMWIRNEFIYPNNKSFMSLFASNDDDYPNCATMADPLSYDVLKQYRRYLRKTYKEKILHK